MFSCSYNFVSIILAARCSFRAMHAILFETFKNPLKLIKVISMRSAIVRAHEVHLYLICSEWNIWDYFYVYC